MNAALNLADGPDSIVVACDVNVEFTNIAKGHWADAGVTDKIRLVIAQATETMQGLLDKGEANTFDFAFVDANKTGYDAYYELCLKLLRPG